MAKKINSNKSEQVRINTNPKPETNSHGFSKGHVAESRPTRPTKKDSKG